MSLQCMVKAAKSLSLLESNVWIKCMEWMNWQALVFVFSLCLIAFDYKAHGSSAGLLNELLLHQGAFKAVCQITYWVSAPFLAS